MQDCGRVNTSLREGLKLSNKTHTPNVHISDYCQLVGKLIYLTNAHSNIFFSIGLVSRFMTHPQHAHLDAAIRAIMHIVKYIWSTADLGIFYKPGGSMHLQSFTDSNWGNACLNTRRSILGFLHRFAKGPMTWSSKWQPTTSLSLHQVNLNTVHYMRVLRKECISNNSCTPAHAQETRSQDWSLAFEVYTVIQNPSTFTTRTTANQHPFYQAVYVAIICKLHKISKQLPHPLYKTSICTVTTWVPLSLQKSSVPCQHQTSRNSSPFHSRMNLRRGVIFLVYQITWSTCIHFVSNPACPVCFHRRPCRV